MIVEGHSIDADNFNTRREGQNVADLGAQNNFSINAESLNHINNLPEIIEEDDNEDLFDGNYEEYHETEFRADKNLIESYPMREDCSSEIVNKRKQLFKIIITRPKREFEGPFSFNDKSPGEEGTVANFEIKQRPVSEYQMNERAFLEMGFETANKTVCRGYQVPKKRMANAYTQVEKGMADVIPKFENITNFYLTNPNKIIDIENFLNKVRSLTEQALQSNETIDIFQNDFDLDRTTQIKADDDKKEKKVELRTFRENSAAGQKSKREKSINYIRFISPDEVYIAHSLMRNLTFEERIKVIGIPYPSQILFWNFNNKEINSPVFMLDIPMEITHFEFCPTNENKLVCALYSGQIIIYVFKDLLGMLNKSSDTESISNLKKMNKKDQLYENFITAVIDSHKTHITAMKWFPKNYSFHRSNLISPSSSPNESSLLATLAEDGQMLIWDFNPVDRLKNDNIPFNLKYVHRVDINKMDSLSKICGTGLELRIITHKNSTQFMVSTDEGQVYLVDWAIRNTQENLTANVKKVYSTRYYRPVIYFEVSPFYNYIFLTLHDYHFCLWAEGRSKPILQSPNLKKSFYTCAKFSPSRPSVIYLAKNNGSIDIWDFLDESHKPSVKEYFIKETITCLVIFHYYPQSEEDEVNIKKHSIEYLAIGDASGQLTLMEVSKLFSQKVSFLSKKLINIYLHKFIFK